MAGQQTPATALLGKLGIAHSVHAYPHDPRHGSYGLEASEAMGVEPERVFKTLVADVDGALTIGVVPVAGQLDLKALAAAAGGKKAAMADVAAAERATGYVAGGISPLGHRRRLAVVVDSSRWGTPRSSAARAGASSSSSPRRPALQKIVGYPIAEESTTAASRRRWPSGDIPPAT